MAGATGRCATRASRSATRALEGSSVADKHELLFAHGVNYAAFPAWQRRGVGLRWETYEKEGHNPKTGQTVTATRRRIGLVDPLPFKDGLDALLREVLAPRRPPAQAPTADAASPGPPRARARRRAQSEG